jgi:hypothetical protein
VAIDYKQVHANRTAPRRAPRRAAVQKPPVSVPAAFPFVVRDFGRGRGWTVAIAFAKPRRLAIEP